MAFRFRLERILKLRERTLQERQIAHARAMQEHAAIVQQIQQIDWSRQHEQAERHALAKAPIINVDELIQGQQFEHRLQSLRWELERQRQRADEVVAQRLAELNHARQQVRTLEKLREKQLEQRRLAELHATQKRLDEVAIQQQRRQQ